jgi:hypothetical protein
MSSTVKLKVAGSSETSVAIYETTECQPRRTESNAMQLLHVCFEVLFCNIPEAGKRAKDIYKHH